MTNDVDRLFYKRADKKVRVVPTLQCKYASLFVLQNRIDVRWGDFSQIQTELLLFETAYQKGPYLIYHLLSGVDLYCCDEIYKHSIIGNSPFRNNIYSGGCMNENACFPMLPIFKFLGTDFCNINFYSKMKNGVDMFTKAVFRYSHAVASFQVGLGVKTEGAMTVAGTKGYVYVPAPWWKTDYFEIRYEDQNLNKKYFYPYVGEGLRYEIKDFVAAILADGYYFNKISKEENLMMAQVQEMYINETNVFKL